MELQWIPSHWVFKGNKQAGGRAKLATEHRQDGNDVSQTKMKTIIKATLATRWLPSFPPQDKTQQTKALPILERYIRYHSQCAPIEQTKEHILHELFGFRGHVPCFIETFLSNILFQGRVLSFIDWRISSNAKTSGEKCADSGVCQS